MTQTQRPRSVFRLVLAGSLLVALTPLVGLAWAWSLTRAGPQPDPEAMQQLLMTVLLVSAVAGAAIAIGLALWVERPLRQVDESLRQLGAGEFSQPISLRGPQDVAQVGERLDWLRRRLAQLEDQKLDFVRSISHELKTPLTAIREGAELLLDDGETTLDQEAQEIAEIMRDSSLALEKLITDLLEFGRNMSPARMLPEYEQIDLAQLLRRVLGQHAIAMYAKQLKTESRLEEARCFVNRDQILTVLDNLMSNAIKYSPEGGTITVVSGTRGEDVFAAVIDDGPGFTDDDKDKVFQPFVRGSAPVKGHVTGTGLGLAIARQLVDSHEGRIEILDQSTGAHVRVVLPANLSTIETPQAMAS